MRHGLRLGALLLTACGTDLVSVTDAGSDGAEVSSGSLGSSESGELGDGDGDGDAGDGDADTADDGDEYPSPFHCDFGPGCYVIHDGSILLDANSTPADFAALECVVEVTGDLVIDGIDSTNPAVSDEDVLAALAGVVVSEPMQVSGNGSGEAPVCGLMGQ